MPQVFLSYRRQDNDHALSIYLWLIKRYGRESVFWDRKDIDAGRDFTEVIADGLDKSAVLIALIGKEWLGVPDDAGQRKIDSPDDWVRRDVEGALVVLPVLGIQAGMPAADTLPKSLEPFSRLQVLSMADMRFYPLLAEKLADVGFQEDRGAAPPAAESRVRLWAGTLLQRQAERLQIRAKELIRERKTERALEELNEGIALMMALLDFVPGEESLEVQLGYIYGAMAQEFEATGNPEMAGRYRDLQLGIFSALRAATPAQLKASAKSTPAAETIDAPSNIIARRCGSNLAISMPGMICLWLICAWRSREKSMWRKCARLFRKCAKTVPVPSRARKCRDWTLLTWIRWKLTCATGNKEPRRLRSRWGQTWLPTWSGPARSWKPATMMPPKTRSRK